MLEETPITVEYLFFSCFFVLYACVDFNILMDRATIMKKQFRRHISFTVVCLFSIFIFLSFISSIMAFEGVEAFPLYIYDIECEREGESVFGVVSVEKPFTYFQVSDSSETESSFEESDFSLIVTVIDDDRNPIFFKIYPSSISLGERYDIEFSFVLYSEVHTNLYVTAMAWNSEGIPLSDSLGATVVDA